MDLLRLLRCARWLTTGQVKRRFFPVATTDAARKRLRILARAGFVVKVQPDRTKEALFTLGRKAKLVLEKETGAEIVLEQKLPKQREHFLAVNDVRIAAELAGPVTYFFGYWELPGLGWRHPVIPDAVVALGNRTFAVEVDRGMEGLRYFLRTKIARYARGLNGLPLTAVLIVTDRDTRITSLAKAIGSGRGHFLYTTLEHLRRNDLSSPVFRDGAGQKAVSILREGLFSTPLGGKRGFSVASRSN